MSSAADSGHTLFRFRDLRREAVAALRANRLRSLVSGLAVFVAAAAVTTVFATSATIATQVSGEFDAIRATSVRATATKDIPTDQQVFPDDAEQRLSTIAGVVAGGVVVFDAGTKVAVSNTNVTGEVTEATLIGVDDSVLDATDAAIDGRRMPTAFASAATVAYLGADLAEHLGITAPDAAGGPTDVVLVDGLAFEIAGVLRNPRRLTETANAVVVPRRTATRLATFEPTDFFLLVKTLGGAARGVGDDIPLVLAPERADPYVVDVPPDANRFRRRVEGSVEALVFAMAALSAFVGAISIASAAYSGVIERTGEFGLRRAFGAKPRHVSAQVVTETLLVAALAGLAGELAGFSVSLVISRVNDWITIADPIKLGSILPAACLLGLGAGIFPARKASRIDPSVALRQG